MTRAPYDHEPVSLRDYFAARAMTGLIEGYDHEARVASVDQKQRTGFDDNPPESESTYAGQLAGEAYIIADAMLSARLVLKPVPPPTRPVEQPEPELEGMCDE